KAIVGPPLTDEECNRFAVDLKEALSSGNVAAAYKMVDWDAVLETAMEGVEVPESTRMSFIQGFKKAGDRPTGVMEIVIAFMKSGASYNLLGIRDKDL